MFFSFNGGRIHYTDSGKGIPVVLLHGYLETLEVWDGFAEKMCECFRIVAVDLPGHGHSDTYGSVHTMEFMATAVKELLDHLHLTKVFLTGHSLGGYVTLAFLDHFADSLTGYSLFHSQPFPDTPETIKKRLGEIDMAREGKKEIFIPGDIERMFAVSNLIIFSETLTRLKDAASRLSGKGITAVLNGMMERPSRVELMEEGRVPCLWILGAMDNYISCETIQKRVNLPANARVVVLQNSGHMGFIEEEDLSVKALSEFIKTLM